MGPTPYSAPRLNEILTPQGKSYIDLFSLSSLSGYISGRWAIQPWDVDRMCDLLEETVNFLTLTLQCNGHCLDVKISDKKLASAIENRRKTLEMLVLIWKPKPVALFDGITGFLQFSKPFGCPAQTQLQIFLPPDVDSGFPWRENGWRELATVLSSTTIYPVLRKAGISVASDYSILSKEVSKYVVEGGKVVAEQLQAIGISMQLDFAANYRVAY